MAVLKILINDSWIDIPSIKGVSTYDIYKAYGGTLEETAFNTLIGNIDTITGNAIEATADATEAANLANNKANLANTKATLAQEAADLANEIATHPPVITSGTWHYWNASTNAYVDSDIAATPYESYLQNTTDSPPLSEAAWSVWSKEQGDYAKEQGELAQTTREGIEGDLAAKIDKSSITSELGVSEELVMSQKGVSDEIAQLADEVSKRAKYPYEDGFLFSALVLNAGIDKWLIDAYFDWDSEEGFRYSFSIISKTNLTATLYKHVDGQQPVVGNVTPLGVYAFVKIPGSKYYKGTISTRPNDWIIADFDEMTVESQMNIYYTDGVGLSPRLFKNGVQKPLPLQVLGESETQPVSQKRITEELGKVIYIEDAFTATDTDVKIYEVEPTTEFYGGAAFAILGSNYKGLQNFTKLIIKTRASDEAAIPTQIKLRIRMDVTATDNFFEPVIYEQTKNVDFSINKTQDLTFSFPNIENPDNKDLFIEIVGVDGKFSCYGTVVAGERVGYGGIINAAAIGALFSTDSVLNIEVYRPAKEYRLKETSLPIIEETPEVEISLPDKIYAVVGDTLQLFYRGIIKAVNPYNYNILINCVKGKQFIRYFEYLPVTGDIGTTGLTIYVKDNNGNVIAEKTCQLITKSAGTSPATMKHIVMAGDSLLASGQVAIEANRRLTGTGGTPAGRGLTNIAFKGKLTSGTTGYFGAGGWTWYNYIIAGENWWKVTVSGVNSISFGATYIDSNSNSFEVREVNITSGSGYISLRNVSGSATPTGTLTKTAGSGDATVAIISAVSDEANPFWSNGAIDFTTYANNYADGQIDVFYMLTNWNGLSPNRSDFTSLKSTARTFIDAFHTQFPNAKFKILGIQLPSLNGGMSAYGANGGYADMYGMVVTAFNQNKAYQELANEVAYSSFVEFVNVSSQFDSENNMPETDKAVNTRTAKTEKIGTNGVHPATEGYYQIADVVFRNFVANFCQ